MPLTNATTEDKLKVFISYSRHDLDFADQLVTVLEWQGFRPIIDRKGIHGAERWKERLGQLILEGDIVVFVLSPDSAASDVCGWEVEEAVRRGKRIVPVLCRPLDGQQPHPRLRDLNYIHFYSEKEVPGSGFGTGQVRLVEALSVDVTWVREHTRLEELAARWDRDTRPSDQLLRGSELGSYKSWRDRRPANAPELTLLQRAFLASSEEEEETRASAERKRLEEMAAAQAAQQTAIEEREAAIKREAAAQRAQARQRRIIIWGSSAAATVIVLGALAVAALQYWNAANQERLKSEAQEQKEAVDNLITRIRVVRSNEHGIEAMKKICDEAIEVTSSLASPTRDGNNQSNYENRFWELYFGPMNLIEIRQRTDKYSGNSSDIIASPIESAMVRFKDALDNPASDIKEAAKDIKNECDAYLQ